MRADGGVGRALEAALREAVRSGRLPAGTRLPGSRSLAADLGVARGTVVGVYGQLAAEGWLVAVTGSATRVAAVAVAVGRGGETVSATVPPRGGPMFDLRPGLPDLTSFPRDRWAASVRRVVAELDARVLGQPEPGGVPELRATIADYVARTRGVRATPDAVVITTGFGHGLAVVGRALAASGARCAATEEPGLARHRDILRAAGVVPIPSAVDGHGADPDELPSDVRAVLLTPAHQHPTGVVLSAERRAAFVAWARRCRGYIVEDDYDGEFRYRGRPVGALQALDPDRVVFAGTASKTPAPGVRIGWLVVPATLRDAVLRAVVETGAAPSAIEQLALADLIRRGDHDRHVRRVRLGYARRRADLAECVAAVTDTPLSGIAAGLHALLTLPSADHERRVIAAAARFGLRLHGLHDQGYWYDPDPTRPAALVIGYATPPGHAWRRALEALAGALRTGLDEGRRPADAGDAQPAVVGSAFSTRARA
ncbi:PLP-dependent aminotransferase family protein [Embleya sp. NPDC059237]|uniref:MocR-like pyridoxine biosynthesis transcription factor PdxR n=1 Tax=Embleya sp. NPDC059237 TaxID=3346784 RepID=UPI00369CE772